MQNLSVSDVLLILLVAAFVFQLGMFCGVRQEERWQKQKEAGLRELEKHKRAVDDLIGTLTAGIPTPPIEPEPEDETRYVN